MDKSKILIVTHEMDPYTVISSAAELVRALPKPAQGENMDVRILMPRFGTINERRHRLHEVVRLSGINIVVNDEDYPLIIKVASLPGARLQVYFLDNEEFFKRKALFEDAEGKEFEDNDERMIFFAQGVLETVKKFGWPPNVIHLNGWMTSLIPLYLKKVYYKEPVFANAKVIYSVYPQQVNTDFGEKFSNKAQVSDMLPKEDLEVYANGTYESLNLGAMSYADKVILGEDVEEDLYKDVDAEKIALTAEEATPEAIVGLYKSLIEE